jgi:hypothetical protein
MRSLSWAALLAVAAFALGFAADNLPAGFDWKSDGKSLILTNSAPGLSFLGVGKLAAGSPAPPVPTHAAGQVKIPLQNVNGLVVYRVEAVLVCERNGCRPCHPAASTPATDCPIPPPIPIGRDRYQVSIDPKGAGKP